MTHLVVVGDLLLDRDLLGRIDRLSPDSGAPVLEQERLVHRPGGAGLAALLAASDGHRVTLVTAMADDADGRLATKLLWEAGVTPMGLRSEGLTAVKTRVGQASSVLVRIDAGGALTRPLEMHPQAAEAIRTADVVLAADYGRGTLAFSAIRDLLGEVSCDVPVLWDPHPRGAQPTPLTYAVTPNIAELGWFVGRPAGSAAVDVEAEARELRELWHVDNVVVTAGSRGAFLADGSEAFRQFAPTAEALGDPCGAGDRFATALAAAVAEGAQVAAAVQRAVERAAAFVASGGAGRIGWPLDPGATAATRSRGEPDALELAARVRAFGGRLVATGGCFDVLHAGHIATLERAAALGDALVVLLNSDASVRRLKGDGRPINTAEDRRRLLEALTFVDAVVEFEEDTPIRALSALRPDIWVKGGDYKPDDLPESSAVRGWDGQVVVVPYLAGRSTTRIVEEAFHASNG
jgi:rfaE bifunctional protein nucleotidyltransferase chain/domain/rfaE bifunctional protein kinase chain/domain